MRVVNLGSVSNPTGRDLRASYALLDARAEGCEVRERRAGYDHAAVRRSRHPSAEYIARFQRGEHRAAWAGG